MMTDMKRMLVAAAMLCMVAVGAFAQGRGRDEQKLPPKDPPPKVVVSPKQGPPPSDRDQNDRKREDHKKEKP
ncbi:MAG: hypothetical protein ABR577_15245 [Pyrinomonadaceae bacterium]